MTASDDPTRIPGPDDAPHPEVDRTPQAASPADAATASEPARTEHPTDVAPTTGTSPTGRRAAERPAVEDPADTRTDVPVSRGGKTATTWIALILGAIVLVLLLIFVIQNNQTAGFEYFSARFDLPLGVAMLLAAIAGALVMALVGSVRMIQMGWTIRKLRKQQEKAQRSLR